MDNQNTLFIAFKSNISERILKVCGFANTLVIPSSELGIDHALNCVLDTMPKYVIELGQYPGKDRSKLRGFFNEICDKI